MVDAEQSSLYPIAVLIDELRSDEISRRLNSVKNLRTIATALGQERTRNELIPYLSELMDDEEQVLLALSEVLATMVDCLGGRYYAHILFDPLEQLCQVEDPGVRSAAVQSFKIIFGQVDMVMLEPVTLDIIKRMNEGEYFTSKSGAAQLIPVCIESMTSSSQGTVLEIFKGILENNQPQVRKSAAENLKFLPSLCPEHENTLLDCLKLVANDKEDTVRLLAVDNLISFCKFYSDSRVNISLISTLRLLLEDKSWRIRYMICDKIADLGTIMSTEQNLGLLCPYYIKFLQDPEAEVRTITCSRLAEFSKLLPAEQIAAIILPILSPLASDVDSVKAALASHINKICPIVGKSYTELSIMKIISELSRDPSADIRMDLFTDLESLRTVIGCESLARCIMPAVQELSEDKQWRIRIRITESIPSLGKQLGQDFFNTHLDPMMKKLLSDSVFSVRESVIKGYKELTELYGSSWTETKMLEEITEGQTSESYLRRMTTLFMVKAFIGMVSEERIISAVVPMLTALASDSVANVKLNVAKLAKDVYSLIKDSSVKEQLKSLLRSLNKDEDVDVKYFADLSLKTCG